MECAQPGGDPHSQISSTKSEALTFSELLIFEDKDNAAIEIPSHRLNTSFWFSELPPEIRNMVYELTLSHHRGLVIGKLAGEMPGLVDIPPHFALGLLRLQKAVVTEAASVLYSCNEFIFEDVGLLYHFLVEIGPHKRPFLQRVRVEGKDLEDRIHHAPAQVAFGSLIEATNLRKLSLRYSMSTREGPTCCDYSESLGITSFYGPTTVLSVARAVGHLLRAVLTRKSSLKGFLYIHPGGSICASCHGCSNGCAGFSRTRARPVGCLEDLMDTNMHQDLIGKIEADVLAQAPPAYSHQEWNGICKSHEDLRNRMMAED